MLKQKPDNSSAAEIVVWVLFGHESIPHAYLWLRVTNLITA